MLVVAPHPDDETLGCGGTIALLVKAAVSVEIIFVTDGSASHPSHPTYSPEQIGALRAEEARVATGILGVDWSKVTFIGAKDGTLASMDEASSRSIVDALSAALRRVSPEAVVLPCRGDGSSEHDAAFACVRRALRQASASPRVLEFPVWAWRNPTRLVRPLLTSRRVWRAVLGRQIDTKIAALASYASQTRPLPPETKPVIPEDFASEFTVPEEYFFEK